MIATLNPAFDFLREHKNVSEATEVLVMKRLNRSMSQNELLTVFENGLAGDYGKVIVVDAQTILGWISQYRSQRNSAANYLQSPLLPIDIPSYENVDWDKEANKCFYAFLNGIDVSHFHPCVYDRMMIDGKIQTNAYLKYFKPTGNDNKDIIEAKQMMLKDVFQNYKNNGLQFIYLIINIKQPKEKVFNDQRWAAA